ncbi:MAG: hypothetical protein WA254_20540 [Candidatus Sulfotelmatobacter sp.]
MSNIAKKQGRMIRKGKEVRFGSVHIDLIGPIELLHNREAKGAAIDFLRTEILASKDWLKGKCQRKHILDKLNRQPA